MTLGELTTAVVECALTVIPEVGEYSEPLQCSELDVAEIVLKLELRFGIDIPDETLLTSISIDELVNLISTEIGE
jgi:acyl carrier protein